MSKKPTIESNAPPEPEYSVEEYAAAARSMFGTSPDIVVAAFSTAGIATATLCVAKQIINEFRNKEVM
ncbi:MAG: hypothetical protein IIY93_10270 [Clostridia bacterium]|nr:hypothetical protein [Clostridia bacterium]